MPLGDTGGAKADLIDGTLGEGSLFDESFGVFADGVGEQTSRLPEGWRGRPVAYRSANTNGITAWCLEIHDLLVAKYLAGRGKDRDFCRAVAHAAFASRDTLEGRLATTACSDDEMRRVLASIARDYTV